MTQSIYVRSKRIKRAGHVLAKIDSTWSEMRKQFLERDDLLIGLVAPIIDYDIEGWDLLLEAQSRIRGPPDPL